MISKSENIFIKSVLAFTLGLAVYLCAIGGYGSDEDTLPMIGVFFGILESGNFMTSRFTGYPVAEIGIGFLSFYFGSFTVNLVTYLNLFFGLIFFYLSFNKKINYNDLILFLVVCTTNSVIFFDNLEPMDYSWALIFFSSGLYFLSRKYYELAVVLFGLSIGVRINFALFVVGAVAFFPVIEKNYIFRKFSIILISIFIGCLFYLPVWYHNQFGLEWLTAARPTEQGYLGLLARFTYKVVHSIGILTFVTIFLFLFYKKISHKFLNDNKVLFVLILANLFLFLYIPAELSYLQIFIISVYYLSTKIFSRRFLYIIIFLNLTTWFINFDIIKIKRTSDNICDPVNATGADFDFHIKKGSLNKFYETRKLMNCWVIDTDPEYRRKILSGGPLR